MFIKTPYGRRNASRMYTCIHMWDYKKEVGGGVGGEKGVDLTMTTKAREERKRLIDHQAVSHTGLSKAVTKPATH